MPYELQVFKGFHANAFYEKNKNIKKKLVKILTMQRKKMKKKSLILRPECMKSPST